MDRFKYKQFSEAPALCFGNRMVYCRPTQLRAFAGRATKRTGYGRFKAHPLAN